VLGVEVQGDSIPSAVHERIDALVGSVGDLPLGLELTGVQVTPDGVTLQASGTDVPLQ